MNVVFILRIKNPWNKNLVKDFIPPLFSVGMKGKYKKINNKHSNMQANSVIN